MNDLIGKLVADKYRVEKLVREGNSGDLYVGRHEVMDKPVMLKILPQALSIDARWARRFIDEARGASAISHPNVLGLTDFGADAHGIHYAVYEFGGDVTLADLLNGEPMAERRAVTIARQSAEGLAAAHERQIVHGHLQPNEIFVTTNEDGTNTVKVYDSGGDNTASDPRYMAPEQCGSFPTTDARSDIYSLGVILFEMLSGTVPFDGGTPSDVLAKINSEPPPPLSAFRRDLQPDVEPILLTAMAVDPEKRYQAMAAFAEDLQILTGAPAAAAAATAGVSKRNIWQTAFIALAGIALLAAALIYATSSRRTDPTAQLQADPGSLPVQPIGPATGAQEESLAKLPEMTEAEIMAAGNSNSASPTAADQMPGGDGYNAWANGGAPPSGAPPTQYVPPGGTMTVEPGGSQFMPADVVPPGCTMLPSGVILCPQPLGANTAPKASPTPKTAANANTAPANTNPGSTPRPLVSPTPRNNPAANRPAANTRPGNKPGDTTPE